MPLIFHEKIRKGSFVAVAGVAVVDDDFGAASAVACSVISFLLFVGGGLIEAIEGLLNDLFGGLSEKGIVDLESPIGMNNRLAAEASTCWKRN